MKCSEFRPELQELNFRFSKKLRELLSSESEVDDAALISIDSKGVDIRVRQGAQVIIFSILTVDFKSVVAGFSVLLLLLSRKYLLLACLNATRAFLVLYLRLWRLSTHYSVENQEIVSCYCWDTSES